MKYLLTILMLACSVCYGQTTWNNNPEVSRRVVGNGNEHFVPGFYTLNEVSAGVPGLTPTHDDIEKHVETHVSLRAKYQNNPLLWAHEEVHKINETMSNALGGVWAFYMLDGRVCAFRDTKIKKSLVAQYTPASLRDNDNFRHYVAGVPENEDAPFILLDEWVAYIASAKVCNELYGNLEVLTGETRQIGNGMTERTDYPLIDRKSAVEFAGFATIVLQCIERFEPDYPDLEVLKAFVSENIKRTQDVQLQPLTVSYQQYFQRFSNCPPGRPCPQPQPQWRPAPRPQPVQPSQPKPPTMPPGSTASVYPGQPSVPVTDPAIKQLGEAINKNADTLQKFIEEQAKTNIALQTQITAACVAGKDGKDGRDGVDGKPAPVIPPEKIAAEVLPLIKEQLTIPVRTQNGDKFSPTVEYPLDGKTPVTLRLRPIVRPKGGDLKSTTKPPTRISK